MTPGLVVKLRPTTPWRPGSSAGARDQVDTLYHSDSLYSAVSGAMACLGMLEQWLDATARAAQGPEVCFSSCFPFQNDLMMVVPPKNFWPPAPSARIRWNSARFIPLSVVGSLLRGRAPDEERWVVDGASGCLTPPGDAGPFRPAKRWQAALDRCSGRQEVHASACLEFTPGAGLWAAVAFANEEAGTRWAGPIRAAFRLLADAGFGGRRSIGWGRSASPEFTEGTFPDLILPADWPAPAAPRNDSEEAAPAPESVAWLWSMYVPSPHDAVDWRRGFYTLASRAGRVESPAASGALKQSLNMIEEGSVLFTAGAIHGAAVDVAPDGFPHSVYRAGFAVSLAVPWLPTYPGAILPPEAEHRPLIAGRQPPAVSPVVAGPVPPVAIEEPEADVEQPSALPAEPEAFPPAPGELVEPAAEAPAESAPEEPAELAPEEPEAEQEQPYALPVGPAPEEPEPELEEPSTLPLEPEAPPPPPEEPAGPAPQEPEPEVQQPPAQPGEPAPEEPEGETPRTGETEPPAAREEEPPGDGEEPSEPEGQ